MKLSPVHSSAIEAVGYDPARRWLEVKWKDQRGLYRYYAVPAEVHAELLRAESMGAYVNQQVKPRYLHELVEESP